MKPVWSTLSPRWILLGGGAMLAAATAFAQSSPGGIEGRVFKLEKEMSAVQRKVFPGGAGLQPEVQAPAATPAPGGLPATSAVADLTSRVDALERQLASVTAQAEQSGYTVRQLQDQMAKMKSDYDYRLGVLEKGAPPAPAGATSAMADTPPTSIDRAGPPPPARGDAASPPPAPSTGDPAEDAYMAGYRLWTQKKYPEAESALKAVVAKYPLSKRASYAQNLLGRAYLDEGKPGLAAEALLKNYQSNPKGERAPDSLYYLGQALVKLNKPAEACKAYGELDDVYGAKLTDPLKGRLKQARADAKCG